MVQLRDFLSAALRRTRRGWRRNARARRLPDLLATLAFCALLVAHLVESFRAYRQSMAVFEFNPHLLEELQRVAATIPEDCTVIGSGNFWLLALLETRQRNGQIRFRSIANLLFNMPGLCTERPANVSGMGKFSVETPRLALVLDETHFLRRLGEYPPQTAAFIEYVRSSAPRLADYSSVQQGKVEVFLVETRQALCWTPGPATD
jgi:hypothetical protein